MGSILGLVSTHVPYQIFPDPYGGHTYAAIFRVQLALAIPNAPRTKKFETVIDSGAARCVFHADIAKFLNLELKSGIKEITNGIGGPEENWIHEVMLYIPGGPVKIKAGFKENLPVVGLLGTQGFFQHFTITFDATALECTLDRIYHA